MNFAMFLEERDFGPRYVYRLVDKKRNYKAEIGFTVMAEALSMANVDIRVLNDESCMRRLWEFLKRESPGSFLEARELGWVAASTL